MERTMTTYQKIIHATRYARWREADGRRETWPETVARYYDFMFSLPCAAELGGDLRAELELATLNLDVMPSMRAMMTAGEALRRDNAAAYNCSFVVVDNQIAFDEEMYLLMCGCGVGVSVERQFVKSLPRIADDHHPCESTIVVEDSRIGWSIAFRQLIAFLYGGNIPKIDYSLVRPAGAPLKTFGGRASGPGPLRNLFEYTIRLFRSAQGRQLNSLECHDLCCKIGEIVVVGGVRRSALISLSNLSDLRMRGAKDGHFWEEHPERAMANNSVAYTERPELLVYMDEMVSMVRGRSGERGIFNREAAVRQAQRTGRRKVVRKFNDPVTEEERELKIDFFTNPCGEILLRNCQFCNLTEVEVRPGDTEEDLLRKVGQATVLGTLQATLTDFRYLRKVWQRNCEEEALLGVSLSGVMDHPVLGLVSEEAAELLRRLRAHAVETNRVWAARLGINQAAMVTACKPAGTTSQLCDVASGLHSRYAPFYIRRIRGDVKDPVTKFLVAAGVPHEPEQTKPDAVTVFEFPMKSPARASALQRPHWAGARPALEQLEYWLQYKLNWTEHNPSCTVYVAEREWPGVIAWVWDHWDEVCGLTFLPKTDHVYQQAPYEEISAEEYELSVDTMLEVDWDALAKFERGDRVNYQELACAGGSCELNHIGAAQADLPEEPPAE